MIALDSRSKGKLIWIGALLAPVLSVQAVRFLASSELTPAAAKATPPAQPEAPAVPAAKPLSKRQIDALAWISQSAPKLPKRSPMNVLEPPRQEPPPPPPPRTEPVAHPSPKHANPDPDPPSTPRINPDELLSKLRLTGVLGNAGKAFASINHRVRTIGDLVAPGWRVELIDTRNRRVTIRHADGRTQELEVPTTPVERYPSDF